MIAGPAYAKPGAGDEVEFVAFGVGEGGPGGAAVFDVADPGGAEGEQPFRLVRGLGGDQVEMESVLDRFGFGNLVEGEPGGAAVGVDGGGLRGGVGADAAAQHVGPELGQFGGVAAVDAEAEHGAAHGGGSFQSLVGQMAV